MSTAIKPVSIPKKLESRKDEIAHSFLQLVDRHIDDLLDGKTERRYHAVDFAKLLFIHPRHLTNTVKMVTGKSPCDFMEERILYEAQKMLTDTTASVEEIGNRFAYNDPTNFIKFFKGLAGITPLQYRRGSKQLPAL